MRWLAALAGVAVATALPGCSSKSAWVHYDECISTTASFRDMAECGKRRRTAYCQAPLRGCDPAGDAIVAYADSLVRSVASREISEPEAQRRWIEFKTKQANSADIADAIRSRD